MGAELYDRDEAIAIVCASMSKGYSLRQTCQSLENFPHESTIRLWCIESEDYSAQIARARELQVEARFDAMQADYDAMVAAKVAEGWEPRDAIRFAKDKSDLAKWELSKLNAKKYGDRTITEVDISDNLAVALNSARERLRLAQQPETIIISADTVEHE